MQLIIVDVGDSVYTCSIVLLVSLLSFARTVIWKHKSKNILGLFGYIIILLKNSNSLHIGFQGMYGIKAPCFFFLLFIISDPVYSVLQSSLMPFACLFKNTILANKPLSSVSSSSLSQ